jgi:hypothetical protein
MMARRRLRDPRALGGVLFVALFISGLILGGALSSAPFPMPGASPQEVARYYDENRTAVLAAGPLQVLSSLALLVFASSVTAFVRGTAGRRGALPALTSGGGLSAAASYWRPHFSASCWRWRPGCWGWISWASCAR